MAPKKSAAKSSLTPATRDAAADTAQVAERPKTTRRRATAAAPDVQAASVAAPVPARAKAPARKAPTAVPAESGPNGSSTPAQQVTDEHIRVRAYFLALESKGRGGSLDYWLLAERELRANGAAADQ